MKTSKLTGAALDWAVAECESALVFVQGRGSQRRLVSRIYDPEESFYFYSPSTDWAIGGPIIERERIQTWKDDCSNDWLASAFQDSSEDEFHVSGPTLLIAAMRCFVASKFGEKVAIPKELL